MLASAIGAVVPPDDGMRFGVVEAINPLIVNVTGGSIPAGIQGTFKPEVGDSVSLIRQDGTWLITGRTVGSERPFPTCIEIKADGVNNTGMTGGTYANMVGTAGQLSKTSDSSVVQVHLTFSMYVVPAQTAVGVRMTLTPVGGTAYIRQILPSFRLSTVSTRTPIGRVTWLRDLPAGDYDVQFQWAVTIDPGSGTLNRNVDDFFSAVIEER
jgi:hypothetical protein